MLEGARSARERHSDRTAAGCACHRRETGTSYKFVVLSRRATAHLSVVVSQLPTPTAHLTGFGAAT